MLEVASEGAEGAREGDMAREKETSQNGGADRGKRGRKDRQEEEEKKREGRRTHVISVTTATLFSHSNSVHIALNLVSLQ